MEAAVNLKRSVADMYPELVAEWSEENTLRPEEVTFGSGKKIIWNGACGHTWEASVKNRGKGAGCPYCSGNQILPGFNDLASGSPELMSEWAEENAPLKPEELGRHSPKAVWWRCSTCGYLWKARVADRVDGHGCRMCANAAMRKAVVIELPKKPRPVTRKCSCGRWMRGKADRGGKCRYCRVREDYRLRLGAVAYYAQKKGYTSVFDSDEKIGIPLALYVPELSLAVETTPYSKHLDKGYRWENPKNWLCYNAGISLFRIILPGDREYDNCRCIRLRRGSRRSLERAVREILLSVGVRVGVDLRRDKEEVLKMIEI